MDLVVSTTLLSLSSFNSSLNMMNYSTDNRNVHVLSDSDESEISDTLFGLEKPILKSVTASSKFRPGEGENVSLGLHKESTYENHIEPFINGLVNCNDKVDGKKILQKNAKPVKKANKKKESNGTRPSQVKEMRSDHEIGKQKRLKSGDCIKYLTVIIDSGLASSPFGGDLIASFQNYTIQYNVKSENVPFTILWTRQFPEQDIENEKEMILVWQWDMVHHAIKSRTLCHQIHSIKSLYQNKDITLVIYGNVKCRENVQEAMIELQVVVGCNYRLINSPELLGQLVAQFTKAIAGKYEKEARGDKHLEWFAAADSRDCVRVDNAGNGLLRLWQQQLCQFNLAGTDVAQAIILIYPSPLSLIQAYNKCQSQKEAELLLENILIRRAVGPLSSARRIGPELSKKIYIFFNSYDGEALLSEKQ